MRRHPAPPGADEKFELARGLDAFGDDLDVEFSR